MPFSRNALLGLAASLLLVPLARAAEADKFIPADSAVVLSINAKQLLEAPLVKKHALPRAKEALKSVEEVTRVLDELGFDPFIDLDRLTVAGPGGNASDRGLVILRGRFDLDKFKARGEKAAKEDAEILKIQKVPDGIIYEVSSPGQNDPLFVALVNKNVLVASPGKDYVVTALKKEAGKEKAGLKDKSFQAVLERMDDKQSISFAGVGQAFKGADLGPAAELMEKVDALGGGLTLGDDLKVEIVLSTKSADDAKQIKTATNDGINHGVALLGLLASQNKQLGPIVDILKTVKATAKDKTVTLKAQISSDTLDGIFDKEDK